MEQKEFEQKLSSVAEWHRPTVADNPYSTYSKKLRKKIKEDLEPLDLSEETECDPDCAEQDLLDNQTLAPLVSSVKIKAHNCEDCDRWCENGRHIEMKVYYTGRRHWRKKCTTCGLFRDPRTGEYTLNCLQVSHAYRSILGTEK